MRALAARLVALLLTTLTTAVPALADWPAEGKMVSLPFDAFNGIGLVRIYDLPSGDLEVLGTGIGGVANGYAVQRIDRYGTLAPGWPAIGVSFGTVGKSIRSHEVGFTIDDAGSAWQLTNSGPSGEGAHLVTESGVLTPGGAGSGWSLSTPATAISSSGFAPAPGGIYAYWGSRLQRMLRSGATAPGWPAAGVATGAGLSSADCVARPDGAGGVILFTTWNGPQLQRFDSTAVRHPGWPAAIPLGTADDGIPDYYDVSQLPDMIRSDDTHFIAAWSSPYNSSVKRVRLQRFSVDGVVDPAWPPMGVQAVAPDTIQSMTLLPDRAGGAYVLWFAHGMPLGTHVRSDGQFVPGTNDAGTLLVGSGAMFSLPTRFSSHVLDYVPADVTPDGGLVFGWDDGALAPTRSIRVRWLLPDLTRDPSEPDEGRVIVPLQSRFGSGVRAIHSDDLGGAYVAWESLVENPGSGGDNFEVWMTRLLPSSLVSAPSVNGRPTLALSAPRPNPARGEIAFDVTLPDDSPAHVELLDVAGRVVRTQLVQGAGPHAISFDGLATLAPGLYFARATTRTAATSTRVVVSR